MERLKNMGLKQSFFFLSFLSLAVALLLTLCIYLTCEKISDRYPKSGITIDHNGIVTELSVPSPEEEHISSLLNCIQILALLVLPVCGLVAASILFYHIKLKAPITILRTGTERIQNQDLDFSIPKVSDDELGQICGAFETMRSELLRTNQELWRQTDERKRLNAAFAHDLRNPITVLKGTIKLLRQNPEDSESLNRLEAYTLRIEQYTEAMSSIQRLEQLSVQRKPVALSLLCLELEETAKFLAPDLLVSVFAPEEKCVALDHSLFLIVAENLIGNSARFSNKILNIRLNLSRTFLTLTVTDDGPGYPAALLQRGPKPFEKSEEASSHFGMGLYTCQLLCIKHGGSLYLENNAEQGARTTADFQIS